MTTQADLARVGIRVRRKEGYIDFTNVGEIRLQGETVLTKEDVIGGEEFDIDIVDVELIRVNEDSPTVREQAKAINRINEALSALFGLTYEGEDPETEPEPEPAVEPTLEGGGEEEEPPAPSEEEQ